MAYINPDTPFLKLNVSEINFGTLHKFLWRGQSVISPYEIPKTGLELHPLITKRLPIEFIKRMIVIPGTAAVSSWVLFNSEWRQVVNTYICVGGAWKSVIKSYVFVGGVWRLATGATTTPQTVSAEYTERIYKKSEL